MDTELSAAVRLLISLLSRKGEKVKESDLEQLALWAKKRGKLNKSSLMFSVTEWQEIGNLLLGRSSTSKQGVIVIPGLIDADFTGQVKILAYALQPPVTIPKGSRIAQIVALKNILPQRQRPREPHEKQGMDAGFGSTGHDVFFTLNLNDRPQRTVILQHGSHQIQLTLLLDTGSDVSIINQLFWPADWPLQAPSNHIIGVGGMKIPSINTDPIRIIFEDNQVIVARPYVMPLPIKLPGLLGRDVLSQIGLVLTTDQHFS